MFSSLNKSNKASSSYFPMFNGDFWNVFIQAKKDPGSQDALVTFGSYQSNFNRNIFRILKDN